MIIAVAEAELKYSRSFKYESQAQNRQFIEDMFVFIISSNSVTINIVDLSNYVYKSSYYLIVRYNFNVLLYIIYMQL